MASLMMVGSGAMLTMSGFPINKLPLCPPKAAAFHSNSNSLNSFFNARSSTTTAVAAIDSDPLSSSDSADKSPYEMRNVSASFEAESVEEALASNPTNLEFKKPENWVGPYQKYEYGWWETFLPGVHQKSL